MKKSDKLMVIHIKEKSSKLSSGEVVKFVKEQTTAYGIPKVEVTFLEPQEGKSSYQIIKHHLKYQAQNDKIHGYIDFVAVGNYGMNFSDDTHPE